MAQILAFSEAQNAEQPRPSPYLKKLENLATGRLVHIRSELTFITNVHHTS